MGVNFLFGKNAKRGGVRGEFGKRPHFFRIFICATFPYAFVASYICKVEPPSMLVELVREEGRRGLIDREGLGGEGEVR